MKKRKVSLLVRRLLRLDLGIEKSWHPNFISHIAEIVNPKSYAEIGIYEGETFTLMKSPKRFAVDISQDALNSISDSSGTIKVLGTSHDLAQILERDKIKLDLIFIDANHAKEEVCIDFINLESHFSEKCVVLFHDTFPKSKEFSDPKYCGDAYAAIPLLQQRFTNWSFVTIPVHPGLTIATRSPLLPEWLGSNKHF